MDPQAPLLLWLRGAQADERQIKRRAQWAVAE